MQTGLAMGTLRAWERRYGFPKPQRRLDSNRRLYSRADLERLLAIREALDRGYRIGDVVHKTLPQLRALTGAQAAGATGPTSTGDADVEALLELLASSNLAELEAHLRRAAATLGPRRFLTDLAEPFMRRVGAAWAGGRLSIRHEHLATECVVTQLRQMLASYQDIDARPLVLLATLPGEQHTLPLQMVALYLVALGAKPRLLGGSTPPKDIIECASALGVDIVGLTVAGTADKTPARRDIKALQRGLPAGVHLWIGGSGASLVTSPNKTTRVLASWTAIEEAVTHYRGRVGRKSGGTDR